MMSFAGIDEAVNMNTKGPRINTAAIIKNAQVKKSVIKDRAEVFFFLPLRWCRITIAIFNN